MEQEPLNPEEQRLYDLLSRDFWMPWYVLKNAAGRFMINTLHNMIRKGAIEARMYVQPARITDGTIENGTIAMKVKPFYPPKMPDGTPASHGNAYPRIFRRIEIELTPEQIIAQQAKTIAAQNEEIVRLKATKVQEKLPM